MQFPMMSMMARSERAGAAAELARPRCAPLEAAFLDEVTVKQTLAARQQSARSKP
jgi:hypothetical protein